MPNNESSGAKRPSDSPLDALLALENDLQFLQALGEYVHEDGEFADRTDLSNVRSGIEVLCEFWFTYTPGIAFFLRSTSGRRMDEIVKWSEVVGAAKATEVVEAARALFPDQSVLADEQRREAYVSDVLEEDWDRLLRPFHRKYDLVTTELATCLRRYVNVNGRVLLDQIEGTI
jgi:hypothetical protein